MENKDRLRHPEPLRAFGSRLGNCKIPGQGYFQTVYSQKKKCSGIKIYKLCDESGYMYDMKVYLGRDSHYATDDMTATHAAVRHLTCRVEGLGHRLFMDNFFSSPRLF